MFIFWGLLVFLFLLIVLIFFTSGWFNKFVSTSVSWASPYECGFSSNSISLNCFSFTYFSLLVFFVIFDLEISLLLNIFCQGVMENNFFFYYSFLIVLCVGFVGEILLGYVRWGY